MTVVLLTRKNWEQNTCLSISNKMKSKSVVLQTGEDFPEDLSMVIRWGCTATIPKTTIINKASAIHLGSNKPAFRRVLREQAPETIPLTWFEDDGVDLLSVPSHFPVIVRPHEHEKGENFHVCDNIQSLIETVKGCKGGYISKFYNKKKEFRVAFIQNKVAYLAEKLGNEGDETWGLASKWKTYNWGDWPLNVVHTAQKVNALSGLDISAVDVILDDKGDVYVCEVNSAPKLEDKYPETKFAMCFDYIVENGNSPILTIEGADNWKHYIHPALSEKAILGE